MRLFPRKKQSLPDLLGALFLSVGPLRAGAETVALAIVLSLGLLLSSGDQLSSVSIEAFIIEPLCAILYSARARLWSDGGRGQVLWREALVGAVLMVLVAVPGITLVSAGTAGSVALSAALQFFWSFGAFAFFRALAYLWPRWDRLRRSRLRWEMTHTTLVVVAAVASVVTPPIAFLVLLSFGLNSPPGLVAVLPAVGISIFLTVVALALILPPAALVSYFAARHTARRLESLVHGTSSLREGILSIRVEVDGEDEVSDLQKDFNAMADDLERAMRNLRSERDNVEQLLKTQRELVASVSHELRTPVATMRGYLESALDGENKEQPIPQDLRDDLEVMDREVIRLQRIIDDLFVLSRTEAGNLPLEIQPTNVATLLARCAGVVSDGAWRAGRVEMIQDVEANLPPALADEGRLEQAVRNLLSNAVRHTPPGGIVALGAAAEQDAIAIEVKDTGEGILPEDLDHVFERFYRSDGARRRDHSGAGLGLALVEELTKAMGGTVRVESEPGSGSRFVLRLPRA